jgi:type II secretory pathway predicted ATPase ExeA
MYNEFYGLSEKPFELLPDPKFLFLTTSHRKVVASVMEEIRNRKGFISITGEVGTGKTTLIRYLLSRFENVEKGKTAFIFHPTITFKDLLKNILLELNLEVMHPDKRSLLHQLNEYLVQMDFWDETLIIIIDEAQDLPSEVMGELGMLPRLAALQIVFVGQPEFEDKLNLQGLRQLKERIGIKHQIRVFSEEESKNYINHRLRLVRSSSSERFTPKAISMICSYAKGIPRVINILCDNAFLMGYSLSQKKIDVDIIRKVIKEMEGPLSQKTFFSSIATAIKEFRLFPPRLNFLRSKASFIILSFLCLGGFVFVIDRYFQPRSAKTWDIKSLRRAYVDTKPPSTSPPLKKLTEQVSGSNTYRGPAELEPASPEFPKPAFPPNAPLALMSEEDKSMKIVIVKKGYTISSVTETYYGMANITLMDFILDLNPEITDVHLILVDQKIKIPKITKELLTTKSADNSYKIHVGTFQSPDFGRFYINEPALKGREVKILPRKVSPQETWYRVVVGPFGNRDECSRVIDQLKEKGLLPAFGGILKME